MSRFVLLTIAATVAGGWLTAAPLPEDARLIVARLGDPTTKVRDEAVAALVNRPDAAPWLRRATRSADKDTAARAGRLLAGYAKKRQVIAKQAIDASIKSGRVDLFMEWHHYWQPENKDDLWPVGPEAALVGQDEYARRCPPKEVARFEEAINADKLLIRPTHLYHDGPLAQFSRKGRRLPILNIRTDRWWKPPSVEHVAFASVAGPAWLEGPRGRFFVLGSVQARDIMNTFVVCDGGVYNGHTGSGADYQYWRQTSISFVACHGDFRGGSLYGAVVLSDGDVELIDDGGCVVQDSLIRASGEIRIPKTVKVVNSKIEAHAKDATAPYKFFELADVGLSLVDDEEGLVVAEVKPNTPFGTSGLAKGDIIWAIDDVSPGHSSEFRKKVRHAMIAQGDCLITVARGRETLDVAVRFPLPK